MKNLIYIYLMISPFLIFSQSLNTPPGGSSYDQQMGGNNGVNINVQGSTMNPINPTGNVPSPHHERDIFWIHGLGGNESSWAKASDWTYGNYLVRCHTNFSYDENRSVFGAGEELRHFISGFNQGEADDFIIAHSQGGVVTRAAIHDQVCKNRGHDELNSIGGFVTFGTPHQGARLLNNHQEFDKLALKFCEKIARAYAYKYANTKIKIAIPILGTRTITLISNSNKIDSLVKELCDTLTDVLISSYKNKLVPQITQSYKVGAPHLTEINNSCESQRLDTMHKVAFYGIEDTRCLMLRTLMYFVNSANSTQFGYFGANPDDLLINNAKKNIIEMESWKNEFQSDLHAIMIEFLDRNCDIWPFKNNNPCLNRIIPKKIFYEQGIIAFNEAIQFMASMDEEYKAIIGSVEYKQTTKQYCECENPLEQSSEEISDPSQCPAKKQGKKGLMSCYLDTKTFTTRLEKDSDGVVLAESAMALPNATELPQKMYITSHMQMRNNNALKHALKDLLFDAQLPRERWFRLKIN